MTDRTDSRSTFELVPLDFGQSTVRRLARVSRYYRRGPRIRSAKTGRIQSALSIDRNCTISVSEYFFRYSFSLSFGGIRRLADLQPCRLAVITLVQSLNRLVPRATLHVSNPPIASEKAAIDQPPPGYRGSARSPDRPPPADGSRATTSERHVPWPGHVPNRRATP